jgi:hypothetical protein
VGLLFSGGGYLLEFYDRLCQTKPQLNALFNNPSVEEIKIIDPRHPLYGRSFPLINANEQLSHRSHVLVKLCEGITIRISLNSTNVYSNHFPPCSKISISAVKELVCLAQDCLKCHMTQETSGVNCQSISKNKSSKTYL